jgi:hypothetical protein
VFPATEQIIGHYQDEAFILLSGEFTPTGLVTNNISFSNKLL